MLRLEAKTPAFLIAITMSKTLHNAVPISQGLGRENVSETFKSSKKLVTLPFAALSASIVTFIIVHCQTVVS